MKKQLLSLISTLISTSTLALILLLSTSSFAQDYQWQIISNNIPDYPYDTTIINNGEDTIVPILYDVFFIDNQEAWIATWHPFDDSAAILHTTDGCRTFEVQMAIRPIMAIYMLDANTGYCGGASGIINNTTDGGKRWNIHASVGGGQITDIDFPPGSDIGYCCASPEKTVRITPDGIEPVPTETPAGLNLSSISFPFEDEGWVSGEQHILHYVEDSAMFIHDQSYSFHYKQHLFFLDGTHNGWCASGGTVLRTEDGMDWQSKRLPSELQNESMQCVYFVNENIGWAVGMNGTIVKSTDGGINWVQEAVGLTDKWLVSVFAIDENHVYVTGEKNTLLMYGEPLSVKEFEAGFDFQIYPNPAREVVSLKLSVFSSESVIMKVYDLNGRKLIEKQIPKGMEKITVDVSRLLSGVYCCRINTEHGSVTKKLIIQR